MASQADVVTPALEARRRYCQENPELPVTLLGRELLDILDELEDLRRQRDALREHGERCHGCPVCGAGGGGV